MPAHMFRFCEGPFPYISMDTYLVDYTGWVKCRTVTIIDQCIDNDIRA
jgi:hypothetical protein